MLVSEKEDELRWSCKATLWKYKKTQNKKASFIFCLLL